MSSKRSQSQSEAQGKKEMEARQERVPAESGQFSRHARNSLALLQGKQVCCVGTAQRYPAKHRKKKKLVEFSLLYS